MEGDYAQLIDLVKEQSEIIKRQLDFINQLIKDNTEKENLINVLMSNPANNNFIKKG